MRIPIPGREAIEITHVVSDFNGTLAIDGKLKSKIKPLLIELSRTFRVYVITSDTQGTAAAEPGLPLNLLIFNTDHAGEEKRKIVEKLGGDRCACVGNGRNDCLMFQAAALSIGVLEGEGLYAPLLTDTDLLVRSGEDALSLLLHPKRVTSGLRA